MLRDSCFNGFCLHCGVGIKNVDLVSLFALEVLANPQHKQLNKAYILPQQHCRHLLYSCVAKNGQVSRAQIKFNALY